MRYVAVIFLLLGLTDVALARSGSYGGSHSVSGYVRSNGTYVAPARATNPNGTKTDNWTTRGNVNPYTGKAGTKAPF